MIISLLMTFTFQHSSCKNDVPNKLHKDPFTNTCTQHFERLLIKREMFWRWKEKRYVIISRWWKIKLNVPLHNYHDSSFFDVVCWIFNKTKFRSDDMIKIVKIVELFMLWIRDSASQQSFVNCNFLKSLFHSFSKSFNLFVS